ncbi:LacI family DNA-binding transcriptional regulator [Leifsonia sp. Le1]|uniref:LacI family DNA-binding transcriptional regulator n=1 Tax=Leifsonia sp. Le1 TaxID=3404918 RepID=UPI003EC0DB42
MAVTLREVAAAAGVSIKTVSNVINGYAYISDATRAAVDAAIAELGYQPNLSARGLRSGRTGVISLVIPDLKNPYFAELADSVMREAAKHEVAVFIQQSGGDRDRELAILRGPQMRMADGILFSVAGLGQEDAALVDVPTPIVLLGERIFHGPADHVTMMNVAASRAATEHLLSLGRRRIVALGAHPGEVVGSAGLRLAGYREALEAAGVEYRDELVLEAGEWRRVDGARAVRTFLETGFDVDGVVAFNDSLAFGAMRAIEDRGFRIPDDVAVIGFDDLDETRYSIPTLSSIEPGRDDIAETAVRLLLARIGGDTTPFQEHEAPFRLVARESTAR